MIKYVYELKRSARRSVSVSVKYDNTITVSAPLRMPVNEIEKFLLSKSGWLERHLLKNEQNNECLSDIISYKKIPVAGKNVPLTVGVRNFISEEEVHIKSLSGLKKLYVGFLGEQFLSLFNEICAANKFTYNKVEFKDYKAKWGCCDRCGNIIFNYKLLMLPHNLWKYVAVHELCHTVYMNHSKCFYALVGRILPSYKTDRKQLKSYSRITRLY